MLVINAPKGQDTFFLVRIGGGRGYGLDIHDESMGLGKCGGLVVIEGKGSLCEVSVDRCTEFSCADDGGEQAWKEDNYVS